VAHTDPRWQQLRVAFSTELEERVRDLNRLLLRLEQGEGGDQERAGTLDALFREAHSLKGAARAVELAPIEHLAHALESALDRARRSGSQPLPVWFDAVYRAVDTLTPVYTASVEGNGALVPGYDEVLAGLVAEPEAAAPAPEAAAASPVSPAVPSGPAAPAVTPATAPATPPSPAAPAPAAGEPAARATAESVRVAVTKLDALLAQSGELSVTHIRVEQRLSDLRELRQELHTWEREWRAARSLRTALRGAVGGERRNGAAGHELEALLRFTDRAEQRTRAVLQRVDEIVMQLRQDTAQLGLVSSELEDEVMSVRLLPVATIVGPFERLVRDLTRQQGKDAQFVVIGGDTEIDRKILEQLRDPLMHMLRNSVDHGIEPPDARAAAGKPRSGTIRLTAAQRGGMIEIELQDDGRGLDPDRLKASAVSKGLLSQEQAAALDAAAAIDLIFQPGFSTSPTVTETSGRGVGMDVVREHVERLNGQVRVESTPGQGTHFILSVPLTLATTRAILVEQGGQTFAIPSATIERTARVRDGDLVSLEGRRAAELEGHPVPVVELADVLEREHTAGAEGTAHTWRPFLVLRQGDRRLAMLADRLVGEQEIVVKSLGWPLRRVRNVGGAAVLGSGQTVVILNPADMLKSGFRLISGGAQPARLQAAAAAPERGRHRVLVVDDSLTTRTLERSILEAAGYDVAVAADGVEALSVLREQPIELIISDIDMPRLDGFGLTAEIRRDDRLRRIPVVLVTSLEAQEHRERGVAVGADAYIVKSGFDQGQLLDTVSRLL
jgi:two-component system chemotaxis sensor kinase CheA